MGWGGGRMDIAIGVVNVMPFCKCYGIGNMLVGHQRIDNKPITPKEGAKPPKGSPKSPYSQVSIAQNPSLPSSLSDRLSPSSFTVFELLGLIASNQEV
jgi:hypothetical protein